MLGNSLLFVVAVVNTAYAGTEHKPGNEDSLRWTPASKGSVPDGALIAGLQASVDPIYIARAHHSGDILPGKLVCKDGAAHVCWGCEEHRKEHYEVLVVPETSISWVESKNGEVPENAVIGGSTRHGEHLYVGRVSHNGDIVPGKVHPSHKVLYIPYNGEELNFPIYEVLVKKVIPMKTESPKSDEVAMPDGVFTSTKQETKIIQLDDSIHVDGKLELKETHILRTIQKATSSSSDVPKV